MPDAAGWPVIDRGFGAHIATGRQCGRAASDDYYQHIPDADWSRAARLCFYAYRRRPVSAWKVVADPTATAEKAIAQTSADATAHRYLLAVYEPLAATSIEVSAHFKPVGGTVDQAAGIAVRFLTPDDYYVVRADVLEDDVPLYRVVNGKRQEIKGAKTKVSANQWHTLGIRAEADRFVVSFDGKSLFAAEEETLTKPGNVALWTEADSLTHFDSISITPLD